MNMNNILWFAAGFLTCFALVATAICYSCAIISKEAEEMEDG